ncbi:hypothetical protein GT409_11650 [Tichowtungia aerotolerans]|uniref:Uncharacterized protein n=2 Tax=Tichowtungia aerotolerans TaxID=2697043 RepID=A0A6P1M8K9_9BACT|nr:hypothetical protein GT409_11650 [Tichowtungia aerotolerans]
MVFANPWPATDSLGRKLPTHEEVGAPRKDRYVAMFYFLWQYQHSKTGPHDITKILAEHPEARQDADHPAWGPPGHYHHFSEPLFGYYRSTDEWVYRKHAEMLADADIDVIVFDCSNNFTYKESYMALCRAFDQAQRDGVDVPKIAFLCRFGPNWPGEVVEIYNDLYGPGLYENLWFHWKGKPLIMAYPENVPDEIQDFFTFRAPMPTYFDGPSRPDHWSWAQVCPQHSFGGTKRHPEQMAVAVAQNAVAGKLSALSHPDAQGRSFHKGKDDTRPDAYQYGFNFEEQWDYALEKDPELIFVTGWNEWVAMRLNAFNGYEAPVVFVDLFDVEHSRDIEPMKGGYGDLYYYQLVSNVRKFKGMEAPDTSGTYSDYRGDTMHRDHPGWGDKLHYIDQQGRNDIIKTAVMHDSEFVRFRVETAAPLTPPEGDSWMLLLIDTDRSRKTGWEGYDLTVDFRSSNYWKLEDNTLELAIEREKFGDTLDFEFKWVDNLNRLGDIMDFYTCGDTAPGGRFNYRFCE